MLEPQPQTTPPPLPPHQPIIPPSPTPTVQTPVTSGQILASGPLGTPSRKSKLLPIGISLLAITLVGASVYAGFLFLNSDTDETTIADSNNQDTDQANGYNDISSLSTENIRNYRFSWEIEIMENIQGTNLRTSLNMTGFTDKTNQTQSFRTTGSIFGTVLDIEGYRDFNSGLIFTRDAPSNPWHRESSFNSSYEFPVNLVGEIESLKAGNPTRVRDGVYTMRMTSEQVQFLIFASGLAALDGLDEHLFSDNIHAVFHISDGHITRIRYDLTNISPNLSNFTMTIEFSHVNMVGDITLPPLL